VATLRVTILIGVLLWVIPARAQYLDLLRAVAVQQALPDSLLLAVAWVESRGVLTALNIQGDSYYPVSWTQGETLLERHASVRCLVWASCKSRRRFGGDGGGCRPRPSISRRSTFRWALVSCAGVSTRMAAISGKESAVTIRKTFVGNNSTCSASGTRITCCAVAASWNPTSGV
jgi:hypothetical protein